MTGFVLVAGDPTGSSSGAPPSDPGPAPGPGGAPGGVTIIPPTGSTVTNLTNGALLVVGDTLTLVGGGLATLGGALPAGVGSIVTLASSVPAQAGAALQQPNQGLGAALNGVLAASLNPLPSSSTLLTPVASGPGQRPALLANSVALVSPRLQQALVGGLTGGARTLAAVTPLLANGAPTTLLAPALAGAASTVAAALPVTGVPTTGANMTGASMTGASMTGATMTGASMTSVMAAPTMTAAPTATTSGLVPTVRAATAPVTPTLQDLGKTVDSATKALGLPGRR